MSEAAVDAREMARLLGVSPDTVRRRAALGELPGVRIGRQWRFWPSEVKQHLERRSSARDPWARSAASRRALNRRQR